MSTIHFYIILFSTHILTRRMTWSFICDQLISNFSTHILTRRMTNSNIATRFVKTFQLTSSQGGWRPAAVLPDSWYQIFNSHPHKEDDIDATGEMPTARNFQLTSSQGGWLSQYTAAGCSLFFQLTSSQGGWLFLANQKAHLQFFNSHPHKEDDEVESIVWSCMRFSTHILTRRMT